MIIFKFKYIICFCFCGFFLIKEFSCEKGFDNLFDIFKEERFQYIGSFVIYDLQICIGLYDIIKKDIICELYVIKMFNMYFLIF